MELSQWIPVDPSGSQFRGAIDLGHFQQLA
jgi:hypothetical protein